MARKRKHPEHVNHERWLVSYADFITLLFAFFVVMFASSNSDQKKVGKLAQAVESGFKQLAVFDPSARNVPLYTDGMPIPANQAVVAVAGPYTENHRGDLAARNGDIGKVKAQLESVLHEEVQNHTVRIAQDA